MRFWKGRRAGSGRNLERAIESGRVVVGVDFQLQCRFFFTGPGRLEIGNQVRICASPWDEKCFVTFSTYHPDAVIRIGDRTVLEGTRLGCRQLLEVGEDCLISEASIMDTDFHSLNPMNRNKHDHIRTDPVCIESGVKIGYGCHILRGVTIGRGTIVRPLSVVSSSLPEGIVAFGFPARRESIVAN